MVSNYPPGRAGHAQSAALPTTSATQWYFHIWPSISFLLFQRFLVETFRQCNSNRQPIQLKKTITMIKMWDIDWLLACNSWCNWSEPGGTNFTRSDPIGLAARPITSWFQLTTNQTRKFNYNWSHLSVERNCIRLWCNGIMTSKC